MSPCSPVPNVEVEIDISDSCNCCIPFKKKKKIKHVEQKIEVEKTDSKVARLPVQHIERSQDSD